MLFTDFKSKVSKLKVAVLGGVEAQFLLAPSYRKTYDLARVKTTNPTEAAVLIIVFPNEDKEACFVLIQRPAYEGHHANQISFPGGKQEEKDNSLFATAIRETREEIGLAIPTSSLVRKMTAVFIPPSGFLVTPYLVVLEETPFFTTNYEVESVIIPKLASLLAVESIRVSKVQTTDHKIVTTPSFVFSNKMVWGATAMMLSELKDLLLKL